jgi:hypothetical protein
MEHFLMILSLVIACIVLYQQFVIIHKQNIQGKIYQRDAEWFCETVKNFLIKFNKHDLQSTNHTFQSSVEVAEQTRFRGKYYKRKNKIEPVTEISSKEFIPHTESEVSNADRT